MNSLKTGKNIILADNAGFCYGVRRAVDKTIQIRQETPEKQVCVLGQLIHNAQVIDYLSSIGVQTIDEIPEKFDGICIIRSHGATPQTVEKLKNSGCDIIDLTCPDVKKVQEKAMELSNEGYQLIIIGKSEHPEVIAIKAYAELNGKTAIVISDKDEVPGIINEIKKFPKIGIVLQTTQKIQNLKEILPLITEHAKEMKIFNTVCPATSLRQKAAKKLAQETDLMIVVGSKFSANTSHLAETLCQITKTIHIETAQELNNYTEMIKDASNIGITAGASTPKDIIEAVINNLKGE